jgi:hypothetical protein
LPKKYFEQQQRDISVAVSQKTAGIIPTINRENDMAESTNPNAVNQSLDRRREERGAEHLMQDGVNRLANIAAEGLEVWQKQLSFGSAVAYWWADSLSAAQSSISQMISTVQNRKRAA